MPWATRDQARAIWKDAPASDSILDSLLADAEYQCAAYAPATSTMPVPAAWSRAVVLQARELWAAARRDGDLIGASDTGTAIRARPLTGAVKSLLRPRRAQPRTG